MVVRLRQALVGTALVGALLTGCSDDPPEAGNLDSDGSEQSDQETPDDTDDHPDDSDEDTPDPDPENGEEDDVIITGEDDLGEVDSQDEAEVEAFIEKFLEAQNTSTATGDFSTEDEMIESCGVCDDSEAYVKDAYDSGGDVEGGLFTEPEISVDSEQEGQISVNVTSVISPYEVSYGDGRPTDSGPAEEQRFQYHVSEIDGQWQIVGGRGLE